MQSENNRISELINQSLKNLSSLIDVNAVVGKPIESFEGDTIIPVSKVTFGVISGGGEYGKVNIFKNGSDLPYSAGNGNIVSLKPCGFLIKSNGEYKVLSVGTNNYDAILDKATDFLTKISIKDNNYEN